MPGSCEPRTYSFGPHPPSTTAAAMARGNPTTNEAKFQASGFISTAATIPRERRSASGPFRALTRWREVSSGAAGDIRPQWVQFRPCVEFSAWLVRYPSFPPVAYRCSTGSPEPGRRTRTPAQPMRRSTRGIVGRSGSIRPNTRSLRTPRRMALPVNRDARSTLRIPKCRRMQAPAGRSSKTRHQDARAGAGEMATARGRNASTRLASRGFSRCRRRRAPSTRSIPTVRVVLIHSERVAR